MAAVRTLVLVFDILAMTYEALVLGDRLYTDLQIACETFGSEQSQTWRRCENF